MVSIGKRSCALALALVLSLSLVLPARAADAKVSQVLSDTANLVLTAASDPQVGPIGGEWAVIGLARSGAACPATWYRTYYAVAETYTAACRGILHEKKYTEYARLILALSALGQDARDLAGYDLTKPLGDFNATVQQGTNGPIWALLALDSRNYPVPDAPKGKTQATRQKYIDRILATQLSDGGWSPSGGAADADLTAMALQALAGYREQGAVARALDRGIACLSLLQTESGALTAWGNATSESTAQGLLALCALGLSPNDPRLVKNGHTLLDGLLTFYRPGQGFSHTDSAVSPMATEQALLALAALRRAEAGQSSLYRMTDAPSL
ncbi:MAG: terpene cyclase/mutase family protein, partial [Ruminiclostridium sp.]|nr:terpene cyclase/mutase family protein [Ruminiclostridium sp.]